MTIESKKRFIISVSYFALIIALVYIAIEYTIGLLTPFLIGCLVASLLKPGINFISAKMRIPRKAVAVISVVLFYVLAGILFTWLGFGIFAGMKNVIARLPEIYSTDIQPAFLLIFENVQKTLAGFDPLMAQPVEEMSTSLLQSAGALISSLSSQVIGLISSAVTSLPGLLLSTVLAIISSVFFAVDYSKITGYIARLFPSRQRKFLFEVKGFATGIGLTYLKAYSVILLTTFLELSLGLSALRVEGAIALAALIAVMDILPVLGTGLVLLPWSIVALVQGNTILAIGLVVLYLIITVVRNIVEPKLVGKQIGLHPLIILICMYVGVKVFGFIGLFILPVLAMIVKYLYDNGKLHDSDHIEE